MTPRTPRSSVRADTTATRRVHAPVPRLERSARDKRTLVSFATGVNCGGQRTPAAIPCIDASRPAIASETASTSASLAGSAIAPIPRGREVEPVDEQAEEQRRGGRPLAAIERRPRDDLEQRGDPVDPRVDARSPESIAEPRPEPVAQLVEAGIALGRQVPEGREAGRRGDRVAVERAAVTQGSGPPGVELVHDVGSPAERARAGSRRR